MYIIKAGANRLHVPLTDHHTKGNMGVADNTNPWTNSNVSFTDHNSKSSMRIASLSNPKNMEKSAAYGQ